ncbi:MAG: hypothetical protein E5W25_18850, partial [Mesorhizobium sp.]
MWRNSYLASASENSTALPCPGVTISPSHMTRLPRTMVPIMLDHVNAGRLTLQRFVDLSSHG